MERWRGGKGRGDEEGMRGVEEEGEVKRRGGLE